MESRTNQSVTPDVQALMLENLKLAKRVEVLENTLSAGKEVLTLEEAARFMGVTAENGGYPPTQNGDIRSLF